MTFSTKILSNTTDVNIDKKYVFEHQIIILEWFLKDHVILKTDQINAALKNNLTDPKFLDGCVNLHMMSEYAQKHHIIKETLLGSRRKHIIVANIRNAHTVTWKNIDELLKNIEIQGKNEHIQYFHK